MPGRPGRRGGKPPLEPKETQPDTERQAFLYGSQWLGNNDDDERQKAVIKVPPVLLHGVQRRTASEINDYWQKSRPKYGLYNATYFTPSYPVARYYARSSSDRALSELKQFQGVGRIFNAKVNGSDALNVGSRSVIVEFLNWAKTKHDSVFDDISMGTFVAYGVQINADGSPMKYNKSQHIKALNVAIREQGFEACDIEKYQRSFDDVVLRRPEVECVRASIIEYDTFIHAYLLEFAKEVHKVHLLASYDLDCLAPIPYDIVVLGHVHRMYLCPGKRFHGEVIGVNKESEILNQYENVGVSYNPMIGEVWNIYPGATIGIVDEI
jgi:hypothetical protein|tara:strand:+ start:227 stop:1198 length:972 start_codon:yes stop_codon:yes gene_type:complete